MKKFSLVIACIFAIAATSFAGNIYFNKRPTLWQNPDILIWTPESESPVDPKELCLSLKRNNPSIGEPKCRLFGEWERDSIAMHYAV